MGPERKTIDTEANVETLRRGYAALNRGDVSGVLEMIAPDIAWHSGQWTPEGEDGRGRESFRRFLQSWLESFEDFRVEPEEIFERGEHLVAVVRQSGRGRASGIEVAIRIAHVWTVAGDQAIGWRGYPNPEAALQAIGAET
jgi:ketosteroid isomerase-like protein